jgi:hypothetical protein
MFGVLMYGGLYFGGRWMATVVVLAHPLFDNLPLNR